MTSADRVERVPDPADEWDAYATACPAAQLGHAAAWSRILNEAYRVEPHYFAARGKRGEIDGILPLFAFRGLTGARALISIPFHDGAGVLTREEPTAVALLDSASAACRSVGATALELRQVGSTPGVPTPGSPGDRVNLVLPLESSEEAQWKAVGAKVRNQTRKAERSGLTILEADEEHLLEAFYRPYAVNMRDLGSPPHSRRFFAAVARHFGDRMRFVAVVDGARPVGGLVAIEYAGRVTVTWASTLRSERKRCPNNLIYWEALRWAVDRGCREFDFGRSPIGEGTYRFKKGWGAEERTLQWVGLDAQAEPRPLGSPGDNRVLQIASEWWKRLPVGLATRVGSRLRRFVSA